MPSRLTYPGVYIEEVPSAVRTITGVATSITAFIGRAQRGPVNGPVRVQSFAEFSRVFGGLWQPSRMSHAVSHFFQHGGSDAIIVRVHNGDVDADAATISVATSGTPLELAAASPGLWGENLRATVDHVTSDPATGSLFNLLIEELDDAGEPVASELFRNVSTVVGHQRYAETVINDGSALVVVTDSAGDGDTPTDGPHASGGTPSDGSAITDTEILGDEAEREGVWALEESDLFNLLCVPPPDEDNDVLPATWGTLADYCRDRRAMLIIDPQAAWETPPSTAISAAETGVNAIRGSVADNSLNAIAVFPRLRMPDPLGEGRITAFAPCGAVAGIIARTDAQRGVWKAPAGLPAAFSGTQGFTYTMTDLQNGILNQVGLNCLRSFPVTGHVLWGARTLAGADALASEWKYVPVRRLALFLEESLYRGTQWVVFEPNDEPLWAQIRLNIGAFMQDLFRQGAFQGSSPRDAYFVKCDRETTTQNDIDRGIVNIIVGFAPLKPAEFVVIKIQQMAGDIQV
jgi:hypothetical protein